MPDGLAEAVHDLEVVEEAAVRREQVAAELGELHRMARAEAQEALHGLVRVVELGLVPEIRERRTCCGQEQRSRTRACVVETGPRT